MREIPLTQGKVALVDDEDYAALAMLKWHANRDGLTFYARHNARHRVRRPDGAWTHEQMHRVILARKLGRPLAKGEHTDHVNGDGLDNRRENLRPATSSQNHRNCRRRVASPSSRYLGVTWAKNRKKWTAQIYINGKNANLGQYLSEDEAALAREFYIAAHPELQARSNFAGHELRL